MVVVVCNLLAVSSVLVYYLFPSTLVKFSVGELLLKSNSCAFCVRICFD